MALLRRACWRRVDSGAFNHQTPDNGLEPPPAEEEVTPEQLAEIERFLAMIEEAETALGCDYPEGPMSPNGCHW